MDLWADVDAFSAIPSRSVLNFRCLTYHPGAGAGADPEITLARAEQVRGGGTKRFLTATGLDQGNVLRFGLPTNAGGTMLATCGWGVKGEPSATRFEMDGRPYGAVMSTEMGYGFVDADGATVGSARLETLTVQDAEGSAVGVWRPYAKDVSLADLGEDILWDFKPDVGSSDVLKFSAWRCDVRLDAPVSDGLRALLVPFPIAVCFGYRKG